MTEKSDNGKLNFWMPAMQLRWKLKELIVFDESMNSEKVLQQKWISDSGDVEWRDVPLSEEK